MTLRLSPSVRAMNRSASSAPGATQDVLIGPVAADGLAAERAGQFFEGPGRQVQDHDPVAGAVEGLGQCGPDPAAADDHDVHGCSSVIGSRTTHTEHGAFLSTYGIVRPIAKSPPKRLR